MISSKILRLTNVILIVLSVLASFTKIFIGMDIDESFILIQAGRVASGEHLVKDLWEIYQTSTIFTSGLIWTYTKILGSYDYIVLFLRIMGTLISFVISLCVYKRMFCFMKSEYAILLSCCYFNFLPRWTMSPEYGLLSHWFITLFLLVLIDIYQNKNERLVYLRGFLAGIFFSAAVLAYPTTIILLPFMSIILLIVYKECFEDKIRKLLLLEIWMTCFLCAMCFCIYILKYIDIVELFRMIPFIFCDDTHQMTGKLLNYWNELPIVGLRILLLAVLAMFTYGLFWILHNKYDLKVTLGKKFFALSLILWSSAFFIIANIIGLKSGPFGLQTRYLVIFLSAVCFFRSNRINKMIIWLLWMPALLFYLASLLASNLSLEVNATFLIMGIFATFILIENDMSFNRYEVINLYLAYAGMLLFCISIIMCKGYLVRITGTSPANIFEPRVQIAEGAESGIWVYPEEEKAYYNKMSAIHENTSPDDVVLYLSCDAIGNFAVNGKYTSVTSHGTVIYNQQWVDYYEEFDHKEPTMIIIDKDKVGDINSFLKNNVFGIWINENYDTDNINMVGQLSFIKKRD